MIGWEVSVMKLLLIKNMKQVIFYGFLGTLIVILILDMLLMFSGIYSYQFKVGDLTLIAGIISFFGAIIGGVITLLGVKITIDKQEVTRVNEKEHHKMLFFMHLYKMYYRTDTLLRNSGNSSGVVFADSISIVPNWEERLLYLDNLDKKEITTIFNWLSDYSEELSISPTLDQLGEMPKINNTGYDKNIKTVNTVSLKNIFNRYRKDIKIILDKYYFN
jgi:hypothetical protein